MGVENRATISNGRAAQLLVAEGAFAESLRALISPQIVREDRRTVASDAPVAGRDAFIAMIQSFYDLPLQQQGVLTPVQIRGSDLALIHVSLRFENGFVVEYNQVTEVDADGRLCRLVYFDTEDEAAAVAELDRRWAQAQPT
jgi:hypothetical protein